MKRDEDTTPLVADNQTNGDGHGRHSSRCRDRPFWHHLQPMSSYFGEESGVFRHHFRISLAVLSLIILAGLVSIPSFWNRLNAPYLCRKDGIVLHCPRVKELPSLWENPYSATTSWKPCAEHRDGLISDLPPDNETTGYIFIHAEGGLNQQRIAICNAVAVAKIMNATLILPVLKQDQIWKDQTKFEDIFDVDHFIDHLKDDVRIVREIPERFTDKAELFTNAQ